MHDRDFVDFLFRFWWLVFPLGWLVFGLARMWLHHRRHNATLELLRTYAVQGKDPPPELLSVLKVAVEPRNMRPRAWRRGLILGSLAVAFAIAGTFGKEMGLGNVRSLFFVALILGALAVASLLTTLLDRKTLPPNGRND